MSNMGYDLGTNNSTVCFYKKENDTFQYLHFDENNLDYFPSMLTYRNEEPLPLIGFSARKRMHLKGSHYFLGREIKLNIGKNVQIRKRFVKDLLRDQIGVVVGKFVEQMEQVPKHIVLTVPAKWTDDKSNGKEIAMLQEVFLELGFDVENQIQFESEPIAAAAYFVHEMLQDKFQGYFLVLDYGGGTLDVTLCGIEQNNRISIVYKDGRVSEDEIGCAGEAFDIELSKALIKENEIEVPLDDEEEPIITSKVFLKLQRCVEEWKITLSNQTTKVLEQYYGAPLEQKEKWLNEIAFSVCTSDDEEYPVSVRMIIEAFEKVNYKALQGVLSDTLNYCARADIDISSGSNFRVILTGGFSNLYCVDATLYEAFQVSPHCLDERFSQMVDRNSRHTAIAHGAAIIAENIVTVENVCSENIGFYYYSVYSEEKAQCVLIEKNCAISNYQKPVFFDIGVQSEWMEEKPVLEMFTDSKESVFVSLSAICPDAGKSGTTYYFGLALLDGVPILYSKNKNGEYKMKSLEFELL